MRDKARRSAGIARVTQAKQELIKISFEELVPLKTQTEFDGYLRELTSVDRLNIVANSRRLLCVIRKMMQGVSIIDAEYLNSTDPEMLYRVQTFSRIKYLLSNLYNRLVEFELCFCKWRLNR